MNIFLENSISSFLRILKSDFFNFEDFEEFSDFCFCNFPNFAVDSYVTKLTTEKLTQPLFRHSSRKGDTKNKKIKIDFQKIIFSLKIENSNIEYIIFQFFRKSHICFDFHMYSVYIFVFLFRSQQLLE